MKKTSLTTETLREVDLLRELSQLLNHTLETEGQVLWAKLFQEKTAKGIPSTQITLTFDEAKTALISALHDLNQKSLKGKLKTLFETGVQSTALFTSAFFGLLLPQNNVILFKKETQQDAITLERASLFVSELFLDWMNAIIARTLEKASAVETISLRIELQKHLRFTESLLQKTRAGLKRGASLRNKTGGLISKITKKPKREIRIPMEGRAFLALENFISQLLRTRPLS